MNDRPAGVRVGLAAALALWAYPWGCARPSGDGATSVSQAWQRWQEPGAAQPDVPLDDAPAASGEPIARVDGRPIARKQVMQLLLAGRGVSVLEELIVLELARHEAEEKGLVVSGRDVEAECDRALRSLLSSLPSAEPAAFDREAAERVLDEVLTSRGVSRQEYRLGMLRNAYLRKLARADLEISEEQLRVEHQQAYGERVRLRHIQLLSGADVTEVQRKLAAGVDFAELARRYSANAVTGPAGGLLAPFAKDNSAIPALLREAAFSLGGGEVSNPIRIDNWQHIIKVEAHIPAEEIPFEQVRHELETRLRRRLIDPAMQRISAELFSRAKVEITDSALGADFFKRHPELRRSTP